MTGESVSIVVPTYKEVENIPILARRVFTALGAAGLSGELVIVDDASNDGTAEAVAALSRELPVRLIERKDERGLSSAVVRGFAEAKYALLVCMDADLSHPPERLRDVIGPVASGEAEFCIGSRYVSGGRTEEDWGFLRKLNSWGATILARPLTSARDPMAGFFCMKRDVFERARAAGLNPIGYKIGLEIMIKARCSRVVERPIEFSDRMHGKSKLTVRQQLLYLKHLWMLYRFRWPMGSRAAVICLVFALGLGTWGLVRGCGE